MSVTQECTNHMRAFVVDDQPVIAATWKLLLESVGYSVVSFSDALSALGSVRSDPPDVLISDVGLPGYSGIELAMTLQQENHPTKVILVSGQAATEIDLAWASAQGYKFQVLPKPVGPERLLETVNSLKDTDR